MFILNIVMRNPKIYLETTIFNFPFMDDAPQYTADTLRLFDEIKAGMFKPYTSKYIIEELNKIPRRKQRGILFSRCGCTQEFNGFLTAPRGGVLNPFGTNKTSEGYTGRTFYEVSGYLR
ncbi:MAG: hypothetical protein LBD20_01330 [Spirochaetaceae bacterium]|jgi:hypothetical protein|nr:hypothetical protein [Spirochaetaceae bacterium]